MASYTYRMLDWYCRYIDNELARWENVLNLVAQDRDKANDPYEYEQSIVQCRSEVDRIAALAGDAYLARDAAKTFDDGATNRLLSGYTDGKPVYMTWNELGELVGRVMPHAEAASLYEHATGKDLE